MSNKNPPQITIEKAKELILNEMNESRTINLDKLIEDQLTLTSPEQQMHKSLMVTEFSQPFYDAAWELCLQGSLRPSPVEYRADGKIDTMKIYSVVSKKGNKTQ